MTVDLNPIIRSLLLQIITANEQISALRIALEDAGILTAAVKASAIERAEAIWRQHRQAIEGPDTTQEELLRILLQRFEGPLQ